MTSITVENGNTVYDSRDNSNAIIETSTNTLHTGCQNTTIPNSVTSIGDDAFICCTGLTSITIPNSVTSIGEFVFYNCTGLTSVTIGNSVTSFGWYAFGDCTGLTSVTIKSSTPPTISSSIFSNLLFSNILFYNNTNATLYVPYGSKSAYEVADIWKDFKEIVEEEEETDDGENIEVTDISQMDNAIYVVEAYEGVRSGRMNLSIRMKNSVTAEGFDFDLILPEGFSVAYTPEGKIDAEVSEKRIEERNLRLLEPVLSADGHRLHISASPANKEAFISGNDGEVMVIGVVVGPEVAVGEHSVVVKDAEIHDREGTYPYIDMVQTSVHVCDKEFGNSNGLNNITGGDYTSILHYLWHRTDASFVMSAADVNCDGYITVSDLTAWIRLYNNSRAQNAPKYKMQEVRNPE